MLFWFREFFPQKMSYLQSCVGCTCVLLSLIENVFRQQQLLWPYCCCCAGRLLVLRAGNEQRVSNRINQDECAQQLLVQLSVLGLVLLSRTSRDILTPVKTPVLVRLVCTLVPRSASVALYEQTIVSSARTGTTEGFRALNCTCLLYTSPSPRD